MRKTCPQEKLAKASHLNAVISYSILMRNTLFLDYYITKYEETRQLKYYEEAMNLQVHAYNVLYFINAETKDMAYLDSLKDKDGIISKKVQIQAMEQLKKKDIEYIKQIQANRTEIKPFLIKEFNHGYKMDKSLNHYLEMSVLYKIPYDELLHEGYWKFYDAVTNYDPKKGKLHTWMYRVIFNHLRQFSHIWVRWGAKMTSESKEIYEISADPIQRAFLKIQDFLKVLDPDARFIVQTSFKIQTFFKSRISTISQEHEGKSETP